MDVANASIYDGASSLAEAALMAHAVTERKEIVLSRARPSALQAGHRDLLRRPGCASSRRAARLTGCTDLDGSAAARGREDGGARHPDAELLRLPRGRGRRGRDRARGRCALLVVVADPVNLGVLEGPGKLGADIVVGEGQGLGVPMGFGGPEPRRVRREERARAPDAGTPRRRHGGPRRQARLRADAADARAAHSPRQGDLEHLHQRGALRPDGHDLPRHARAPRARPGRGAVDGKGPLRGRAPGQGSRRVAAIRRAVLQGVRAQAAEAAGARRSPRLARQGILAGVAAQDVRPRASPTACWWR